MISAVAEAVPIVPVDGDEIVAVTVSVPSTNPSSTTFSVIVAVEELFGIENVVAPRP